MLPSAGGGDTGVALGDLSIALNGGEHAGGVVGDDRAAVQMGIKGDPAEFVEREDIGPGDVEGAVQRGADSGRSSRGSARP